MFAEGSSAVFYTHVLSGPRLFATSWVLATVSATMFDAHFTVASPIVAVYGLLGTPRCVLTGVASPVLSAHTRNPLAAVGSSSFQAPRQMLTNVDHPVRKCGLVILSFELHNSCNTPRVVLTKLFPLILDLTAMSGLDHSVELFNDNILG